MKKKRLIHRLFFYALAEDLFGVNVDAMECCASDSSDEDLENTVKSFWLRYGRVEKDVENRPNTFAREASAGECQIHDAKDFLESADRMETENTRRTSLCPANGESNFSRVSRIKRFQNSIGHATSERQ
mmetsp:Transcript_22199/g.32694  ORF Transcript_22199/g.32694 Transcript_22199/m.32694 type:complete len:129 (+) Transcript_22199:38-424(+)